MQNRTEPKFILERPGAKPKNTKYISEVVQAYGANSGFGFLDGLECHAEPESSVRPTMMTVFATLMKLLLATLIRGLPQMAAGGDSALHQQGLIDPAVAKRFCLRERQTKCAAGTSTPRLFGLHVCRRDSGRNLA